MNKNDYYKNKYIKYKFKYFQTKNSLESLLASQSEKDIIADVKVGHENPDNDHGLIQLIDGKRYSLTGIISCIGIIVRTVKEGSFGDLKWCNTGYVVHFVHGSDPLNSHFIDTEITMYGNYVVEKLIDFINNNQDKQIFITFVIGSNRELFNQPSSTNPKVKFTKRTLDELIMRFKDVRKDIIFEHEYGKSHKKFYPKDIDMT